MYNSFTINGIKISEIYFDDIKDIISDSLKNEHKTAIAYVNQNLIVLSNKNSELKESLNQFNYNFADGTGIWLAAKWINNIGFRNRFNLTDYCKPFFQFLFVNKYKVCLLGSSDHTLNLLKDRVQKDYPKNTLQEVFNGYADTSDNEELIRKINKTESDVLLVGMGSPKQELWIAKNFNEVNVKVLISVGDLFSEAAGQKIRGPKVFQKWGFEWLFRVIASPVYYFRRYIIGIPKFFYLVLIDLLNKKRK